MTATEYVILVDKNDQEIGKAEKLTAHKENLLHRAFSIFIFREMKGELQLLLQQRALSKYHSPGLWTNSCCSHPHPGEELIFAAKRRLLEELGMDAALKSVGWFHYNVALGNGLSENEIDHVLVGMVAHDVSFKPNTHEVHATRWISIDALEDELDTHPENFTAWFEDALMLVLQKIFL